MAGADTLQRTLDEHAVRYRPLGAYLGLTAALNGLAGAFLLAASRRGALPERYVAGDLALLSVATFRLSRLISRDRVTAGLRAPFTRFQSDVGHGEVEEAAQGRGLRRAIGELLVCHYCVAQWVAGALVAGLIAAPRPTRAVAATFTVYAAADALQLAWSVAEDHAG